MEVPDRTRAVAAAYILPRLDSFLYSMNYACRVAFIHSGHINIITYVATYSGVEGLLHDAHQIGGKL